MIKNLNQENSRDMLRKCRMGRLACIVDDEPYVVPVNYFFDGESVFVHSLPGRKISAMRVNPRVCLQVDDIESDLVWKSVMAFGRYEEITSAKERSRVMNRLLSSFPQLTPVESVIANDAETPAVIVFCIRIDKLTGLTEGH